MKRERPPKLDDTLLIVDDRADVLRALERLMRVRVERVYVASTPEEVERQLREHSPRCMLCDYYLGEGQPLATTLIAGWRRSHPCLECVALMTGTNTSSIPKCPEVDTIFHKPLDVKEVVAFFSAHRREVSGHVVDQI